MRLILILSLKRWNVYPQTFGIGPNFLYSHDYPMSSVTMWMIYYWTVMCGAESNTAAVAMIVNSVKMIKQNLQPSIDGRSVFCVSRSTRTLWHTFIVYYWTMMCGAERSTATVVMIVNSVKMIKQNLKSSILQHYSFRATRSTATEQEQEQEQWTILIYSTIVVNIFVNIQGWAIFTTIHFLIWPYGEVLDNI